MVILQQRRATAGAATASYGRRSRGREGGPSQGNVSASVSVGNDKYCTHSSLYMAGVWPQKSQRKKDCMLRDNKSVLLFFAFSENDNGRSAFPRRQWAPLVSDGGGNNGGYLGSHVGCENVNLCSELFRQKGRERGRT